MEYKAGDLVQLRCGEQVTLENSDTGSKYLLMYRLEGTKYSVTQSGRHSQFTETLLDVVVLIHRPQKEEVIYQAGDVVEIRKLPGKSFTLESCEKGKDEHLLRYCLKGDWAYVTKRGFYYANEYPSPWDVVKLIHRPTPAEPKKKLKLEADMECLNGHGETCVIEKNPRSETYRFKYYRLVNNNHQMVGVREDGRAWLTAGAGCNIVSILTEESRMVLPTDSDERKHIPIGTGVIDYFPLALAMVAQVSKIGNDKHNQGQPLHWSTGKSCDHSDALIRHFVDRYHADPDNNGLPHAAGLAWRALALLETMIREQRGLSIDHTPQGVKR